MQDFKIQKIQKALKGIRKNDDKDHELTIKNELEKKSKTDSPIKYLKPKEINHSKSRSFNGNFDENEELSENTSKQTTILPPVLKKAPTIQSALIKPILINSSNSDMKKRNKEELKIEDERSKLKEDMYVFLYGRSYQKEEKKEIKSDFMNIAYNSKIFDHRIMSVKNSWDDTFVAIASYDGYLKFLHKTKKKIISCYSESNNFQVPITNIRWKPNSKENLISISYLNGDIILYNFLLEKELHKIHENYQIYGLDYNTDGSSLGFCGNDIFIKVHDCNTMKLSHSYSPPPLKQQLSHNNYGIKFHQTNPNIFFTGGRDEIIYLWDMRSPTFYSNYLTGPLICSESLDNSDEKLLTGSWRSKNQIELWDLRRFRKIQDLDWDSSNDSMVQVCKFGKIDSKNVMAAGINGSGVQIFKEEEGIMKIIERFDLEDDADYYTADFSNLNSSDISFGNNKGHLLMFNLLK